MKEIKRMKPWLGEGLGLEDDHHDEDDDHSHIKTHVKYKIIRDEEESNFVGSSFQPTLQEIVVGGGVHHGVITIVTYDDHNTYHPAITLVDNISSSSSSSSSLTLDIISRTGFLAHRNLCDDDRKSFANMITTRKRYLSHQALKRLQCIPSREIASHTTMRMKFLNYFFYTIRYNSNESSIVLIQTIWRRWIAIRYVNKKRNAYQEREEIKEK